MAFHTYTATNREVEVPLALDYTRTKIIKEGTHLDVAAPRQFYYTRRARKTYRFKGMDEATAQACLAEKKRQYTRRFMDWTELGYYFYTPKEMQSKGLYALALPDYFEQVGTFNVVKTVCVYDVQITIDETTALYSFQEYDPNTAAGQALIESLFQAHSGTTGKWCYVPLYDYDET